MAYTLQEELSDGIQTVYLVDLEFSNKDTIFVYTGEHNDYEAQLSYRWLSNGTQIELLNITEVPAGTTFYIRRVVPRDKLVHTFENKSIRGKLVDEENLHALYLIQEILDGFRAFSDVFDIYTDIDMHGNRIRNLATPVEPSDAATKNYVDLITRADQLVQPIDVPPFEGNTFTLPYKMDSILVTVNGRLLSKSEVQLDILSETSSQVTLLKRTVTEADVVVARVAFVDIPDVQNLDGLTNAYADVATMVAEFEKGVCITLAYNRPVLSAWQRVSAGAGDMTDGTLSLDKGGYAKIQIEALMDVRAFGAHGDHVPGSEVMVHDDSDAIINAIRNCKNLRSTQGDNFAITKHIPCNFHELKIDFSPSGFFWFGQAGPIRQVGRDRAMFEVYGEFTGKFSESGPWTQWVEGAETFPADDTTDILSREFIILSVGNAPSTPAEAYMVRPMPVRDTVSNPATRFQTDYRLGWTHDNAVFSYFGVEPIKNVEIKLGHVQDMTNYEYDEVGPEGHRLSASAVVLEAAWNCKVEVTTSKNFQYPTVMTYYTTDCEVSKSYLLPSERVSLGIDGWGIVVQWNNALRPRSIKLGAQGNRRVLDFTQCCYWYVEDCGGESTRDGEMTTHGVYEHNGTYVNTRGFMSFANSGPEFGESTKNISVTKHHGSDIFAVTNVTGLSLKDCRADSFRVNSVGLVMDNCTLYDLETSVNNLCQINNWSAKLGKPYEPKDAVIKASKLGSNGLVFLVDEDVTAKETIHFVDGCEIQLRQGDFAGPANIVFEGATLTPKNGVGQLVLVSNPTSLKLNNCKGYNVGFEVPETPFPAFGAVKVTFNGGEYVGKEMQSAFWSNRDIGFQVGNYVKFQGVHINWDNETTSGTFFDPLGARNIAWYVKVTDCDIQGTGSLSIPTARRAMHFGGNTLHGVTKDIGTLNQYRIEYGTIELDTFSIEP